MEVERVCCMCGDVGFSDKIFRCVNCHNRFQHSYCSNYYSESSKPLELCDWCKIYEIQATKSRILSKKPTSKLDTGISNRSEYTVDKIIKQRDREAGSPDKGKSPTGVPSPRTATRRYKLLKDVMC